MTTITNQHIGNASLMIEGNEGSDQIQVTTTIDGTAQSRTVNITWEQLSNAEASGDARNLTDLLGVPVSLDAGASSQVAANLAALDGVQVNADMYSVMALFQKMAQEMRNTARVQRDTEMQAQVSALNSAADQMHVAAQKRFEGAVIQGAMQIAGGVIQIGTAVAATAKTVQGAKLESQATELKADIEIEGEQLSPSAKAEFQKYANADATQGKILSAEGDRLRGVGQGVGGMLSGMATTLQAAKEKEAAGADEEKARLEAQAKIHETASGHASDMMSQMMDVLRDVREKLQSIQQSALETNRGIARNI
jgi:hypothetical protein